MKSQLIKTFSMSLSAVVFVLLLTNCSSDDPLENNPETSEESNNSPSNEETQEENALVLPEGFNGTIFYIDPDQGSMDGDGSEAAPWRTLQEVIDNNLIASASWSRPYSESSTRLERNTGAPVSAGDMLVLMSGYHGNVSVIGYVNDQKIYVKAGVDQEPQLSQLFVRSSSNWSFSGLSISPIHGEFESKRDIVRIESHGYNGPSSYIDIEDTDIFSIRDASNWTVEDWREKGVSGLRVGAENCLIKNNTIENIGFGIQVLNDHVNVVGNKVINFSGDALRGLGNDCIFENNFVANAIKINANHDDGFQSWSRDGIPVSNVILRGNQFYTNYNHPNTDLLSEYQGIGCFDGFFNNWRIENNLLEIDHWHGISVYGANDVIIINNTVIDGDEDPRMIPWIRIFPHKNGSEGTNNVVRNNIGRLSVTAANTTVDFNLVPSGHSDYATHFTNRANRDYTLKASSSAIGGGTSDLAPAADFNGNTRGNRIDQGAFQATP